MKEYSVILLAEEVLKNNMNISNESTKEFTTVTLIIGLIVSFILGQLWIRFFNNFFFVYLGNNRTSSWVVFVLAFLMTVLSLIIVFNLTFTFQAILKERAIPF